MIITVDIPLLGEVTVLTSASDRYEVTCGQPDGITSYQIQPGTLFLLQCNFLNGALVVYLDDVDDGIDTTELISHILTLDMITYQAKTKTNIFEPQPE